MIKIKFRRKVLSIREKEGLTLKEVASRFDVGVATVTRWIKHVVPQANRHKPVTKIDMDLLAKDVEESPDSYQYERAAVFLKRRCRNIPLILGVCADSGYPKTMEEFVTGVVKKTIEISARISQGWAVLPKRWAVERTFAWLNHFRRLSKDYEICPISEKNYVMIAHSMIL